MENNSNLENKEQAKDENKNIKIKETLSNKKENKNIILKDKNSSKTYDSKKNNDKIKEKLDIENFEKKEKYQDSKKSHKFQEKLKKIFLEREKAKYKYNKQLIPDQLKYNSEDEESSLNDKKEDSIKNLKIKTTENFFNNKKSIKKIKLENLVNNVNSNIEEKNGINIVINDKNENLNNNNNENKNRIIEENKSISKNLNIEKIEIEKKIEIEIEKNESKKIKTQNLSRNDNNIDSKEFKKQYYKLLNSKTAEELNVNKEKNKNKAQKFKKGKSLEKEENYKNEPEIDKTNSVNKELSKEKSKTIFEREVEIATNDSKNDSENYENFKKHKVKSNREKAPSHSIDNFEKKNVLKILELIKSKKSERDIIHRKKEEIIKRSNSMAIDRKKETKKEEKEEKIEDLNSINTFSKDENTLRKNIIVNTKKINEIKPILTSKKIYRKNPTLRKVNSGYKPKNFLTEAGHKNKSIGKEIISCSLNINNENNDLLLSKIKTNKFVINNKLQNIKKKNNIKEENENIVNKTEASIQKTFYQTSNQIIPIKRYEKPRISVNNNNFFNSTNYFKKSLSKKNKYIFDYETNPNDKYHQSIIYSPKKMKIQKMNSESHFPKKNNMDSNINISNYYIKKKSLLNDKNLSKSNYNIYDNFPNIHNYYNNSKIFLKNKFISIHPSFSINNNFHNNNIDEIEINSNPKKYYLNSNNERNNKNSNNLKRIGIGEIKSSNQRRYIYHKNKINIRNNRNSVYDKTPNEKESNESENIDDINYENLRLGTEEMTYNRNRNALKGVDSFHKVYPENSTLYHKNENKNNFGIKYYNHIYRNKNISENRFLEQCSPLYKRKLKKIKIASTLNNNENYKRNYRLNNNNSILINLENILIFEEKFNNIILYLKKNLPIMKQSLDLWNYFFNFCVYEKIEKIFFEEGNNEIIKICNNYLLLSIMICYHFSQKNEIFNNTNYLLLQILEIIYNTIMLIFQQIKNNYLSENINIAFFSVLTNIYIHYIQHSDYLDDKNVSIIQKIYNNTEQIDTKIKNILSRKKIDFFKILYNFYYSIKKKSYKEINNFFIKYILNEENINGSLFSANYFITNNSTFTSINPPFLKSPNKKKLTLIMDLNETLVNFKLEENGEGYVRIRPFLFGFLEEIGQLYELIVFTSSEKNYADSLIEAIEHERTYFDHVFYRQHTIIIGNDFVKDLTKIGRPLNSTIIIDNMPQSFKFQKENGILIKPFWGEDSKDRTLYELMPILLDIAKEGGDVRYGLNKYRNEIIGKITSNIAKRKFDD